jgi:hypothetical protein
MAARYYTCRWCKTRKPAWEFVPSEIQKARDGSTSHCRDCHVANERTKQSTAILRAKVDLRLR